jgi:SlyX protein
MHPDDGLAARVDALEIRLTHQEQAIEDLNATITAQWQQIDRLVRQIALLNDQLQEVGGGAPNAPEPPPPHY